jgi:hypothetical protein
LAPWQPAPCWLALPFAGTLDDVKARGELICGVEHRPDRLWRARMPTAMEGL